MYLTESASQRTRAFSVVAAVLTLGSFTALAQAPAVVADAQQILGMGFNQPQSIAISSNGTIYVADTYNNQIIQLTSQLPSPGENQAVILPANISPALATPNAIAVDSAGDLFIGDIPAAGTGRIIELTGDGAGNLTGNGQVVYSGNILSGPVALALDSAGTLYIGDYNGNTSVGQIFTITAGGTTPTLLNTGLPNTILPGGLSLDSAKDLFIVDNNNAGLVYKLVPGSTATPVPTGQFTMFAPASAIPDAAGNLFILTQLVSGGTSTVIEIPAADPATPFLLPTNGIQSGTNMTFDPSGNLNVVSILGSVYQLNFKTPVNMGYTLPSQPDKSVGVLFNFELNTPKFLRGFKVVSQGDASNELTQSPGGTCTFGNHNTVGGLPTTAYNPYTCSETYTGTGAYPGLRYSAIDAQGSGNTILASVPVYQTTFVGAQVVYPLTATVTAKGLMQPQALALSGLDKTLYIADTASAGGGDQGYVYSTNGPAGTRLTRVSTGGQPLLAPSALAVDGAGNLFIADFDRGVVIEVPPGAPNSTRAIDTGGLLQHPIAMTFDYLGNLYIGDAGPGGVFATSAQPGFIVEVPLNGAAFKLNIPNVPVIFPQALATDPYTPNLFIGDGGDASGGGQVVELSADHTTANVFPVNNVTNPTGLGFDAAENLYVLDGTNDTLTSVAGAQLGNTSVVVPFDNSSLSAASALAVAGGGQSFVIANIGSGSNNNLLFVNGKVSTLNFGSVAVGQSADATATISNIGNFDLTLAQPPISINTYNPDFSFLGSSTCYGGLTLSIYGSCTMSMQFTPAANGLATASFNILSDGYNSGTTFITEGTGTGGANLRRPRRPRR